MLLRCPHKDHTAFYPLLAPAGELQSEGCWINYPPAKCYKKYFSLIKPAHPRKHQSANCSLFPGKWNDGELDLAVKKDEFLLCTKRGQLGGLPFQSILSGKRFKTKGKQPFLTSWTGAKLTLATRASVDRSLARLTALSSWHHFRTTRYPSSLMLLCRLALTPCHFAMTPCLL